MSIFPQDYQAVNKHANKQKLDLYDYYKGKFYSLTHHAFYLRNAYAILKLT